MADLIDSYTGTGTEFYIHLDGANKARGQSFTGAAKVLDSCKFSLAKSGATGNVFAKCYSHSGVFGASSVPNALLATSGSVNLTAVNNYPTLADVTFTFSGANRVLLAAVTKYVIVCETDGGTGGQPVVMAGLEADGAGHGGNESSYTTSWAAAAAGDLYFKVYGVAPPPLAGGAFLNLMV
jgi:hypothetical protein